MGLALEYERRFSWPCFSATMRHADCILGRLLGRSYIALLRSTQVAGLPGVFNAAAFHYTFQMPGLEF